jgi:aminomethyltransferase
MEGVQNQNAKRTPLYEAHVEAGGKLVDFHGWLLPIQYGSILQEHENVRTKAGLFDVSHMGELVVSGPDAFDFLQGMLTNELSAAPGKAVYSPMCYQDGGTVDDLIVYRLSEESYMLVVNAANTEKDYQWLCEHKKGRVSIANRSEEYAQLAIQGPVAETVLQKLTDVELGKIRTYHYAVDVSIGDVTTLLSRTGYTGEDGFELYCRPEEASRLWSMLMDNDREYGLLPAGLGARDTLRLEAGMPLYGQELSEAISPVEAGLERFVKPGKGGFTGRDALLAQLERGLKKRIAGFEMIDRAVPRNGYEIFSGGVKSGQVTSGGFFPTLKKNMGLALLDAAAAKPDSMIEVKVRDGLFAARIVRLPFYKREKR